MQCEESFPKASLSSSLITLHLATPITFRSHTPRRSSSRYRPSGPSRGLTYSMLRELSTWLSCSGRHPLELLLRRLGGHDLGEDHRVPLLLGQRLGGGDDLLDDDLRRSLLIAEELLLRDLRRDLGLDRGLHERLVGAVVLRRAGFELIALALEILELLLLGGGVLLAGLLAGAELGLEVLGLLDLGEDPLEVGRADLLRRRRAGRLGGRERRDGGDGCDGEQERGERAGRGGSSVDSFRVRKKGRPSFCAAARCDAIAGLTARSPSEKLMNCVSSWLPLVIGKAKSMATGTSPRIGSETRTPTPTAERIVPASKLGSTVPASTKTTPRSWSPLIGKLTSVLPVREKSPPTRSSAGPLRGEIPRKAKPRTLPKPPP